MKKQSLMWAVAATVALSLGAQAEEMKCPIKNRDFDEQKAALVDTRVQQLTEQLGLDADQQTQVKALMEKKMAEKKAIHEDSAKKIEAAQETAQNEIRALLTSEQQKKFDALKAGKGECCGMGDKKAGLCPECAKKKGKAKASCPMSHGKMR